MKPKNQLKIKDLHVDYVVARRKVKYPRLEIKTDVLHVIVPENYGDAQKLIKKHEAWIYNKLSHVKLSQQESRSRKLNLKRPDREFKEMIQLKVEKYTQKMDVKVNQIKFRRMKSRWGSCTSKRNITFNLYLKYLPENLIGYIIFHELAHLIEMSHNRRFQNLISAEFPDYKELEDELFIYWLKVKEYVGI
ncbi:MAG TPA: M48 family metallopeptidase [Methanobacterium sp.]